MYFKKIINKLKLIFYIYRQLSNPDANDKIEKIKQEMIENEIINLICKCSDVTKEELLNKEHFKNRKRELVTARQLHMSFVKLSLRKSQKASGAIYGKDHATVIHSIKTIKNLVETDKNYRIQFSELFEKMIEYDHSLIERLNLKYLYK